MTQTWTLGVARTDLARTILVEHELSELADGEALLRVDRVGLTANNVTYAVLGDAPCATGSSSRRRGTAWTTSGALCRCGVSPT